MSDPKLPSAVPAPGDARTPLDAAEEDLRGGGERALRRAATEQLPAARPYVPLPDEEDDDDEPTATVAEEAPPAPRAPPRRTHTEPLQPTASPRAPTPARTLRPVGPDPWAGVPDGVSARPAPPPPPEAPRADPTPARTRELRAPDPIGARPLGETSFDDEAFEVTDPVDPGELALARATGSPTAGSAAGEEVSEWTAPPALAPRWEPTPRRRARAERVADAPAPPPGLPDNPAAAPVPPPMTSGAPASRASTASRLPERGGLSVRRPGAARPSPAPSPPAVPASPRRISVARLFRVDYRDNEKTAVEPVTFRPPPFWKVFPERPEWWFVLSLLAVLVMGGALLWRVTHRARQEALAQKRAEQQALPPWMRGPRPPPPPPGMVWVPTGSGHELRYEDPGMLRPPPAVQASEDAVVPGPEAAESESGQEASGAARGAR